MSISENDRYYNLILTSHQNLFSSLTEQTFAANRARMIDSDFTFDRMINTPSGERAVLVSPAGLELICYQDDILNLSERTVGRVDLAATTDHLVNTFDRMFNGKGDKTEKIIDYIYEKMERRTGRSFMGLDISLHGSVISEVEKVCREIKKQNLDYKRRTARKQLIRRFTTKILAHYFQETESWLNFDSDSPDNSDLTRIIAAEIRMEAADYAYCSSHQMHFYPNQFLGYLTRLVDEGRAICLNNAQAEALNLKEGMYLLSNNVRVIVIGTEQKNLQQP